MYLLNTNQLGVEQALNELGSHTRIPILDTTE